MEDHEKKCATGGGGTNNKTSGRRSFAPTGPASYLLLLVGVIYIISKLFS